MKIKIFRCRRLGQKASRQKFNRQLLFFLLFLLTILAAVTVSIKNKQAKIIDLLTADFNNDGERELALIVWKRGSFGKDKPFWIKQNDDAYSSHLFLYKLKEERLVPYWHSSRLENPICKARAEDINKDGQIELVVEEGKYTRNGYSCQPTKETQWKWNGWGFTRI